ncbi:hypothetical protein QQ045_001950 [Rhodiola kirilowii]
MEITTSENEKQPSATLPLLIRIDRLETAMRHLEMKQISSSSSGSSSAATTTFSPSSGLTSEHQHQLPLGLDLDMALKESSFKASLLERIKTLENRLFQLRLRVESDKMEARSRRVQLSSACSFPIFMMNQSSTAYKKLVTPNASLITNNNVESQRTLQAKEEDVITSCKENEENSKQQKQKKKKKKSKFENGDHEKRGKRMSEAEREKINWAHFRILGC